MISKQISRRQLVSQLTGGLGAIGLAGMFAEQGWGAPPSSKVIPAKVAETPKFPNCTPKGSWISYGLGSENKDLPGFVVLSPGQGNGGGLARSGFLPARHQGTYFDDAVVEPDKMIRYLTNKELDKDKQRTQLDLIQQL